MGTSVFPAMVTESVNKLLLIVKAVMATVNLLHLWRIHLRQQVTKNNFEEYEENICFTVHLLIVKTVI
jgi:hypothetical protein